jgi:hypothetical protein
MWGGCAVLAAAAWCWSASAQQTSVAETPVAFGSRGLITHFSDQPQASILTVVDPQTRVMAVYHINRDTGGIKLKSVRNFELDLRLSEYNGGDPKPDDVARMFQLQE